MKKVKKIAAFFAFIISACCCFALDSKYFTNLNLDHLNLYVDSPEGLRIRDKPSLSSNKIGKFYDNMEVKPVEVGKQETIDGIESNWIKVIIPADSLAKNKLVYGWIFGGYVNDRPKAFSTENWTDDDLLRYLSRFSWVDGNTLFSFTSYKQFTSGLIESSACNFGIYSVSLKNKKIVTEASYNEGAKSGPIVVNTYDIELIDEGNFVLTCKGKKINLKPAINNSYYHYRMSMETPSIDEAEKNEYIAFCYPCCTELIVKLYKKFSDDDDKDAVINFLNNLKKQVANTDM